MLLEAKALDSKSSAHLIPPPSLPSFPIPTVALVPLYHHLHSFCLSSSLSSVFPTECLQTSLEERQRMPLEEKAKGRRRAGCWRAEVRQLLCSCRRHHLHHGLGMWNPLQLCGAPPGSWVQPPWWK